METIIAIIAELKAWVKFNFENQFRITAVEINPVIYLSVEQTIKKEWLAKSPLVGDMGLGVYSIEGIRILKSKDPLSGIHIRLEGAPEPEYCPKCGLPPEACICEKEEDEKHE